MAFHVPDLPYAFDALEPHIDAQTMEIHHDKHHAAYVTNANAALEGTEWADKTRRGDPHVSGGAGTVPRPQQRRRPLQPLALLGVAEPDGGGEPTGALADAINSTFGSFADFQEKAKAAGVGRFGSGWAWLVPTAGPASS